MAVSAEYRAFVLEQLGRVRPVSARAMFGGVGIYADGLFFALMAEDALYLKTDDATRPAFAALGMEPFRPFGEEGGAMGYHRLPGELLEDPDRLRPWVDAAVETALRARTRKRPRRR